MRQIIMRKKSQASERADKHIKLFIPGPTEVRPEVLGAQADWMIVHRMPECAELIGRIRPKLRQVFMTEKRVLINASTGTGFTGAAIRNAASKKCLTASMVRLVLGGETLLDFPRKDGESDKAQNIMVFKISWGKISQS